MMTVFRTRSWIRRNSSWSSARVSGSSAPKGSSIRRTGGSDGKGPGDADALALASGQLVGPTRRKLLSVESDELEQVGHPLINAFPRPSFQPRHDGNVPGDCHMWKQSDLLQYVSDAAPQPDGLPFTGVTTLDEHGARLRQQEAIYQLEKRRFARSAAPDHRQNLAGIHAEREAVEHEYPARPGKRDITELNGRIGHRACDGTSNDASPQEAELPPTAERRIFVTRRPRSGRKTKTASKAEPLPQSHGHRLRRCLERFKTPQTAEVLNSGGKYEYWRQAASY